MGQNKSVSRALTKGHFTDVVEVVLFPSATINQMQFPIMVVCCEK